MQWVAGAAAAIHALDLRTFGDHGAPPPPPARGYGTDPPLNAIHEPGAFWPLTLTEGQRRTATALCDLIIPADDRSPAASEVGVVAFVDEWISAPYPRQQEDRARVLAGLAWLEEQARARFASDFADLSAQQQRALCDPIRYLPDAAPELAEQARFFATYRNLTAGAFYASPAGWQDVGYVGNVARAAFDGPPKEVLERLGLVERR